MSSLVRVSLVPMLAAFGLAAHAQQQNQPGSYKEFATYMLRDHARDVNFYQREANRTQNADLKGYAQNTAQTMQTELQKLESIAKTVEVDQKTIASAMKHTQQAVGAPGAPTGREKGRGAGGMKQY